MDDAYEIIDYPMPPIPPGGYVQSPVGVFVPFDRTIPRYLCGIEGCVFIPEHTCDHSWEHA